jgi:hypothetical protein
MQYVAYPPETRTALAALELQWETGTLTEQEHASQAHTTIAAARTLLGLDASWQIGPTPPMLHNPNGRAGVFWKP